MLDVKRILAKILLRFNNYTKVAETQTFTALNKSWKFRRIGNVVYVDAPSDANGSVPAGTSSIGTLPASMRPEDNVYLKCTNNNADWRLYIAPTGAVTFYHPTATSGAINCGFSGYSFIVGGGYFITSLLSTLVRGWRYVRCEETAGENTHQVEHADSNPLRRYIHWENGWVTCRNHRSNGKRLHICMLGCHGNERMGSVNVCCESNGRLNGYLEHNNKWYRHRQRERLCALYESIGTERGCA